MSVDGPWENLPTRGLASEECVRAGGHCWYTYEVLTLGSDQYTGQRCKHCPATRSGTPRDPYDWTYPDGQP